MYEPRVCIFVLRKVPKRATVLFLDSVIHAGIRLFSVNECEGDVQNPSQRLVLEGVGF